MESPRDLRTTLSESKADSSTKARITGGCSKYVPLVHYEIVAVTDILGKSETTCLNTTLEHVTAFPKQSVCKGYPNPTLCNQLVCLK